MFNRIQVWALAGPLKDMSLSEHTVSMPIPHPGALCCCYVWLVKPLNRSLN